MKIPPLTLYSFIQISTLESFADAIDTLASELSGFESDLEKVILTNDPQKTYGNYMIRTTQSLFFVRNNLLVDLAILGSSMYGNATAWDALCALASTLDTYLARNSVPAFQARRAAFQINTIPQQNVVINTPFDITLAYVDGLAEEMGVFIYSGQSSVKQPIISTSVGPLMADTANRQSIRRLSFLPLQKDMPNMSLGVDIAISGAHYDTFYPVTKITKVTIQ